MTTQSLAPVANLRPRQLVETGPWPRSSPARPSRGTGRQTRPQARPDRRLSQPMGRPLRAQRHGCAVESAAAVPGGWRLTDRGVAMILTVAVMIAVAAVTVIGLTALRVTSPTYQPYAHARLAQP